VSATVEARVAAWVADHPGHDARQIAAEVRARLATVREVLASPLFTASQGPGRAQTYVLSGGASKPLPLVPPVPVSQAQKMQALLADGGWHSIAELWAVGVGRPNSRASELRKRGLNVEHRQDRFESHPSRAHQYRLVALDESGCETVVGASAALSSSVPAAPTPPGSDPCQQRDARTLGGLSVSPHREPGAQTAEQLTLTGVEFRRREAA
jgi:hypothetical protein